MKQAIDVVPLVPEAALLLGTLHHFATCAFMADTINVAAIFSTGGAAIPVPFGDTGPSHTLEVKP